MTFCFMRIPCLSSVSFSLVINAMTMPITRSSYKLLIAIHLQIIITFLTKKHPDELRHNMVNCANEQHSPPPTQNLWNHFRPVVHVPKVQSRDHAKSCTMLQDKFERRCNCICSKRHSSVFLARNQEKKNGISDYIKCENRYDFLIPK